MYHLAYSECCSVAMCGADMDEDTGDVCCPECMKELRLMYPDVEEGDYET